MSPKSDSVRANTIPVYESVIEPEVQDEVLELLLDLERGIVALVEVGVVDVSRIYRLAIHFELFLRGPRVLVGWLLSMSMKGVRHKVQGEAT